MSAPHFAERLSLAGKHALVCGASAGIGRAAALALASCGARVTPLARRAELLEGLMPELRAAGGEHSTRFIVANLDQRPAALASVDALLGEAGPVHILVNNTGGPPPGLILDAREDDFLQAFQRHVLAAHGLVRAVLPGMREAGYGRIINVVSTSVREPIANLGVSNTVRGAMASWAKSVSKELPPGLTINNVLPGYTATERLDEIGQLTAKRTGRTLADVQKDWLAVIPEKRLAEPDEIGGVIAFLASPAAAYVRGVSLAVDGGRMMSL
jgi:3-oxoacyl-[acyl-carrier protein] reductase